MVFVGAQKSSYGYLSYILYFLEYIKIDNAMYSCTLWHLTFLKQLRLLQQSVRLYNQTGKMYIASVLFLNLTENNI